MLSKNLRHLFAASFATALLLVLCAQPTLAGTVIGFEIGEGFPAAAGSIDGLTTNNNLATWSTANLNQFIADSGPGDGFGFPNDPGPVTGSQMGLVDGMDELISQVTLELSTPKALDSFWYAYKGGKFGFPVANRPIFPRLEVEYFDTSGQSIGFNSFMAPYNMDGPNVPGSYPGGTTCQEFPAPPRGCGVGLDGNSNPEFHQIFPTEPFKGVALSKVIFNSFENPERMGGALNVGTDSIFNFPPNVGTHSGSFYLDDITLSDPTTTFNPNNYLRISFEPNEGFPDAGGRPTRPPYSLPAGGVLLQSRPQPLFPEVKVLTRGAGVEGIIDSFSIEDNLLVQRLQIDHGPGCGFEDGQEGFCVPDSEPDPIHGTQLLSVNSLGAEAGLALDPDFTVEIDLNDDAALAPVSFWYSYRGNGSMQTVDVEYFDLSGTSQGIESWEGSLDGEGAALGMDIEFHPHFDKIVIGEGNKTALPAVKGMPLSKMIINSTHNIVPNNCGSTPGPVMPCAASFAMDDLLFECTTGACPDYPDKVGPIAMRYGDFTNDDVVDDEDIDDLVAAIRDPSSICGGIEPLNGGCPPVFHQYDVDGLGDPLKHVPDEADFSFYITNGSRYLGTLFGDYDLNKIVNFADFVILSNNFGMGDELNPTLWSQGNGNTDNVTNFVDFVLLSNNFGMMAVASGSNSDVPEPASLAITAVGVLVLAGRWKSANSRRI